MVGDAQNEVVRSMPSNRRGATVPAVRREGALAPSRRQRWVRWHLVPLPWVLWQSEGWSSVSLPRVGLGCAGETTW